jgi:hypothetical protein
VQQVPCVAVLIEPTLGVGIIRRLKGAGVIREQPSHLAIFVWLAVLSGLREPFPVRREKDFGNEGASQNMNNGASICSIIVIMVEIDPAACRRWSLPEDHS